MHNELQVAVKDATATLAKHTGAGATEAMLIPPDLLAQCRGIAVLWSYNAGLGISITGGTGLLIAKRPGTEEWGLPVGLGIGGIGIGLQIGMSSDYQIIVLNSDSAVTTMCKDNIKYAAALNVAAGPHGRNFEGAEHKATEGSEDISAFTYGFSEGIFAGASLKAAFISQQDKWNAEAYGLSTATPVYGKTGDECTTQAVDMVQGHALDGKLPTEAMLELQEALHAASLPLGAA
ncbi:hypothetical protein FOA52_000393 [Chlamydomonas sp. UWO 241]|nr:hypothetical protein FOA52_000393 [Chlamydomonas sp. UWO 241]